MLGLTGMGYLTAKTWGESQSYVPFDHPLLNEKSKLFLVEIETIEEAKALNNEGDEVVFVLPVRMTIDGQIVVLKESTWQKIQQTPKFQELPKKATQGRSKIQYFRAEELLDLYPAIHNLEGFLQSFPQRQFVFQITDSVENIHKNVLEIVGKELPKGAIAVASPIEAVVKSIKNIRPLTAFSLSQAEQIRLLSFDSIGLVSIMQIDGDFIFSDLTWKSRPLISKGLVTELHRRRKKVFVGPISSEEQFNQAQSLDVDGIIVPDTLAYQNLKKLILF